MFVNLIQSAGNTYAAVRNALADATEGQGNAQVQFTEEIVSVFFRDNLLSTDEAFRYVIVADVSKMPDSDEVRHVAAIFITTEQVTVAITDEDYCAIPTASLAIEWVGKRHKPIVCDDSDDAETLPFFVVECRQLEDGHFKAYQPDFDMATVGATLAEALSTMRANLFVEMQIEAAQGEAVVPRLPEDLVEEGLLQPDAEPNVFLCVVQPSSAKK